MYKKEIKTTPLYRSERLIRSIIILGIILFAGSFVACQELNDALNPESKGFNKRQIYKKHPLLAQAGLFMTFTLNGPELIEKVFQLQVSDAQKAKFSEIQNMTSISIGNYLKDRAMASIILKGGTSGDYGLNQTLADGSILQIQFPEGNLISDEGKVKVLEFDEDKGIVEGIFEGSFMGRGGKAKNQEYVITNGAFRVKLVEKKLASK